MKDNYVGIENDLFGGMTDQGRIIRDAWVFGILPESQGLHEKVYAEWEKYGHLPSRLPDDLRVRYMEVYEQAVQRARAHGWDPELADDD
jgi:hypothetical protein